MSVGVDVGGTFTDLVAVEDGHLTVAKTASTPDQSEGVENALAEGLGDRPTSLLIHGTTVATNALLERDGAEVLLVTDPGYEDLIEIARQNRRSLYDPVLDGPEPLVRRNRRVSRVDLALLDGVESVVIGTVGGYADPERELELAVEVTRLRPDLPVAAAGVDFGEFREFERINTAVVNAFLRPKVEGYLANLERRLIPSRAERILVMRSSGGSISPARAARLAATILLSGPAGGVVASAALGEVLGLERVIAFDMGGTSTDVTRVENGRPEISHQRSIDGHLVRVPSVAVHTVGAGGGSIGWADPGGALRVGPRSAGAFPGPASYGRGGMEPAVTDANVALGRLPAHLPLAGGLALDPSLAREALSRLGKQVGLDGSATAAGMIEVVEATMEQAVRAVSVEQGSDPRGAFLMGFGGAGGLHATSVARRLDMAGVVIPPMAGVFSALGLILTAPRHDSARSVILRRADARELDPAVAGIASEALREFTEAMGVRPDTVETMADVRYVGQAHEISVAYHQSGGWETLTRSFHDAHRERNGFARVGDEIEVVTVRATALGRARVTLDGLLHHPDGPMPAPAVTPVIDRGDRVDATVWWRHELPAGAAIAGPAIVRDGEATVWLAGDERATVDPTGALMIEW